MEMNDRDRQVALNVRLIYTAVARARDLLSEHDRVHYDCHLETVSLYSNSGVTLDGDASTKWSCSRQTKHADKNICTLAGAFYVDFFFFLSLLQKHGDMGTHAVSCSC